MALASDGLLTPFRAFTDEGDASAADEPSFEWSTLRPTNLKAASGATLAALEDGAVLVSGKSASTDVYSFKVTGDFGGVTALRVETCTDASLPRGGPGRGRRRPR